MPHAPFVCRVQRQTYFESIYMLLCVWKFFLSKLLFEEVVFSLAGGNEFFIRNTVHLFISLKISDP